MIRGFDRGFQHGGADVHVADLALRSAEKQCIFWETLSEPESLNEWENPFFFFSLVNYPFKNV